MDSTHDVIVIGGGPAGTTCATILARQHRDVLLLEQHKFPRFHIGESLTAFSPEVFRQLGVYDELKALNYVEKRGLEYVSHDRSRKIYFPRFHEDDGGLPWAFQMARSKLDLVLLENARRAGTAICERHGVKRVLFDGDRAVGVVFRDLAKPESPDRRAYAKWIVDASGQSGVINRQLRTNCYNDILLDGKVAVFSHWKGGVHVRNSDDDLNFKLCVHRNGRDWAWYLPIEEDVVSIGLVLSPETVKDRDGDLESLFRRHAPDFPVVGAYIAQPDATRIEKYRAVKDFSYRSKRYCGNGWALVGDGAGFIDPVFSTGLQISFNSALRLCEMLAKILDRGGDVGDESDLHLYSAHLDKMYRVNSTLVYLFYISHIDFRYYTAYQVWRNIEWAGLKYRVAYLWHLLRLALKGRRQRLEWFEQVLFGKWDRDNLWVKFFLAISDNYERIRQDAIREAKPRQSFADLEV